MSYYDPPHHVIPTDPAQVFLEKKNLGGERRDLFPDKVNKQSNLIS